MSLIKGVLLKNYISDIYEASNGFFYSVAEDVDFYNPKEMSLTDKFKLADQYGLSKFSVSEIDDYFGRYLKYNKYDIISELHLDKPVFKDVADIYANEKIIYATLVMSLRLDVADYLTNMFYKSMKPQQMLSIFEDTANIKYVDFYVQAEFKIDDILREFKIKNVCKYKPSLRAPSGAIHYDANMIPATNDYELLARRIREKYNIVVPVDIDAVLCGAGLKINSNYSLEDKMHGLVCLSDGEIKINDTILFVTGNTILIDKNHIQNYGIGSYRFNVLHEIVHFEYHKLYLTLKRQLVGADYAITDSKTSLKKIEEQANKVASLLLVPSEQLSQMLLDSYVKYDFYKSNDKYTILNRISNLLSEYFNCSKTCMHQRIKSIKIYTGDIDLTEIDNTYINEDEVKELCNENEEFKELIDTKQVIYNKRHCVINDEAYIKNDSITYYAYRNPKNSMVMFSRVHKHRYNDNINFLSHITVTKNLLNSILQKIKSTKYKASIDVGAFINKVFEEDKYDNLIVGDVGRSLKNIREYKKIGYNTLSKITGLDVKDIYKLENNLVKNPTIKNVVLICKGLGLPVNITKILAGKLGGFEKSIEDKVIEFIIDNNYNVDCYEFYEIIQDGVKAAEMIENENKELLKVK